MDVVSRVNTLLTGSHTFCLATVVSASASGDLPGTKMILFKEGAFEGGTGEPKLDELIRGQALKVLENKKKRTIEVKDGIHVFFDILAEKARLVICGAGHIAVPLAQFALKMGFSVTVLDDRPDFADPARFEGCDTIAEDFGSALQKVKMDPYTFVVIITRGHEHDAECLAKILPRETAYVGLIGSRRRVHFVLEMLSQQGFSRERLEDVFTPIGVPIGSESPEEIALSIAAELVSVRRKGGEYTRKLRRITEIEEKENE